MPPEPIYPYVRMNTGPRPTPIGWADISTVAFPDVPFSGTPTEKMSFDESIDAGKGDIFGYGKLTGVDIKNITPTLTLIDEIGGEKAIIKRINTNNELTLVNAINKPGTGIVSKAIVSSKDGVSSGEGGIITIGSADATLNLLGTIGAIGLPHNGLASIQGGTTAQYYHLTSAEYSALHSAVTIADTASVDLALTGQQISAVVLPAGVDHNLLAGKQGGTTSEYYHLTSAEYSALHPAVTISDTNSINLTLSTQALSADLLYQDTTSVDLAVDASGLKATVLPAGVDHNSLGNLTVGNPHTQYSLINAQLWGDLEGYLPVPYIKIDTEIISQITTTGKYYLRSNDTDTWYLQSFTLPNLLNDRITSIPLKLSQVGTIATGKKVWLEVYAYNPATPGPTGGILGTSASIYCDEIGSVEAVYKFAFNRDSGLQLTTINTEGYCFVLKGDYDISADNHIGVGAAGDVYAGGEARRWGGVTWDLFAVPADLYFSINVGYSGSNIKLDAVDAGSGYLPIANLPLSIPDRKFAQITTASKVSGAAITLLTSIPSGAGVLPIANGSTGQSVYAVGDILYASSTSALSKRAASTYLGAVLINNTLLEPAWLDPNLTLTRKFLRSVCVGGTGQGFTSLPAWDTIAQADVSGLTTASSPTFAALTLSGLTVAGIVQNNASGVLSTLTYSDWAAYTPTWTASVTNPVLGNGTLAGRYCQFGKTVIATIRLVCGSTTTYGNGLYSWALPVQAANQVVSYIGSARMLNSGVAYKIGQAKISANATGVFVYTDDTGYEVFHNQPFTWKSGDQMEITVTYEVA